MGAASALMKTDVIDDDDDRQRLLRHLIEQTPILLCLSDALNSNHSLLWTTLLNFFSFFSEYLKGPSNFHLIQC